MNRIPENRSSRVESLRQKRRWAIVLSGIFFGLALTCLVATIAGALTWLTPPGVLVHFVLLPALAVPPFLMIARLHYNHIGSTEDAIDVEITGESPASSAAAGDRGDRDMSTGLEAQVQEMRRSLREENPGERPSC